MATTSPPFLAAKISSAPRFSPTQYTAKLTRWCDWQAKILFVRFPLFDTESQDERVQGRPTETYYPSLNIKRSTCHLNASSLGYEFTVQSEGERPAENLPRRLVPI